MLGTESIILLTCVLYVSLNYFMYHFKSLNVELVSPRIILFFSVIILFSVLYLIVSYRPLAAENQSVFLYIIVIFHMYRLICDTIINSFLSYLILSYLRRAQSEFRKTGFLMTRLLW